MQSQVLVLFREDHVPTRLHWSNLGCMPDYAWCHWEVQLVFSTASSRIVNRVKPQDPYMILKCGAIDLTWFGFLIASTVYPIKYACEFEHKSTTRLNHRTLNKSGKSKRQWINESAKTLSWRQKSRVCCKVIRGSPGLAKSPLIVASVLIVTSRFVCDWRKVRHFPNEPFFPSCFDRLLLCLAMVSWFVLPWTLCSGWPSPNFELGLARLAIYIIFNKMYIYPHFLIFYINTSMSSLKWTPQWNHRLYQRQSFRLTNHRPGVRSTSQVPWAK